MVSELPYALTVEGKTYAIDPSTSNCLNIMQAYEDFSLLDEVKHLVMVRLLYVDTPKVITAEIVAEGVKFLDGGEDIVEHAQNMKRVFSFTQDIKYIRAAVQRTHGVNLREADDLHWWKFLDMFIDLDEECVFSRMVQLRCQQSKGKLTKEEKKAWNSMKDILVLKTPESYQAEAARDAVEKQLEYLESLSLKGGAVNG
jgi:hypothetical protein